MAITFDDWHLAQNGVLGSALIEPSLVPKVIAHTSAADYIGPCRTVYETMRSLFLSGNPVDVISISSALGPDYRDYLLQLMEITPTAANIDNYIRLCHEQAQVMAIREIGASMATTESTEQARSLIEDASRLMVNKAALKISSTSDALKSFMDRHTQKVTYLTWPVQELNDRLYAEPGDLILIGGYPSAGKTAWALQCAWHWAKNYRVGFYSLETSSEKLFDRLMASISGISMDAIKRNDIPEKDWTNVATMSSEIIARNLDLIPAAGMTPADVRAVTTMRRHQIIIIDYLQLLSADGSTRYEQVTNISIALHLLAQSMGVTVVALSQMRRPGSNDKKPSLTHLRESGQLEQDADIAMLLSLADKDNPGGNRIMNIAKNKEGTCPNILLAFDGKHQTFTKAQRTGEVIGQLKSAANKAKRERRKENMDQMSLLPPDTPVPFEDKRKDEI